MTIVDFRRLIDLYTLEGSRTVFERICGEILSSENPNIVPVRANPGDNGIDMYHDRGNSATVYQCKFFTDQIEDAQKKQIRDSFKSAKEHLGQKMTDWILLIPKNLDSKELAWFNDWKNKQTGFNISWWGQDAISAKLSKYVWIEEKYFQSGQISVLKEMVALQAKTIEVLRDGFSGNIRKPSLTLKVLAPNKELIDYVPVSMLEFDFDIPAKENVDKKQLIKLYSDVVTEKEIEHYCESYSQDWEASIDDYKRACKIACMLERKNFIYFAVENSGRSPANDIDVRIVFPANTIVFLEDDIFEIEKLTEYEELISPNEHFRGVAEKRRSERIKNQIPTLEPSINRGAFYGNIMSHIPINLPRTPLANSEIFRTDTTVRENEVSFWLKKVKHNNGYDHPIDGVFVCFDPEEGENEIKYYLSVDDLEEEQEGKLVFRFVDVLWDIWSPFSD